MITGLELHQAVQLSDGTYIVCIANGSYEINGNILNLDYRLRQYRIGSLDDIKSCKTSPQEVDYFKDGNGRIIPSEARTCAKMLAQKTEGTALADTFYENFIRFAGYQVVYKPTECVKTPVDFAVIGVAVETDSEFIECSINCGLASFSQTNGLFKVYTGQIAINELKKFDEFLYRDNYSARYTKMKDGTYLFSKGDVSKYSRVLENSSESRVVNTFEEAKAIEKDIRRFVSSCVNIRLNENSIKNDIVQYNNLYRELTELALYVKQIDPKIKSYAHHRSAVNTIEKIITELREN